MTQRPPLHLHLLAHPKSELGNQVASDLMTRFVEPPVSGGLRVPVFFTPDRGNDLPPQLSGSDAVDLDRAAHSILVVLADARMAQLVDGGTGDQWRLFIEEAIATVPSKSITHHVLPIVLEYEGFDLVGGKHFLPALLRPDLDTDEARERQLSDISLQLAARALRLLREEPTGDTESGESIAPVSLFISHAKADLASDKQDPAYATMNALVDLPIEHWFDAADIGTSEDFALAIQDGIENTAIVVAFQTDHYDSRPWCRREVLAAKEAGAQLLLVDALRDRVPRHFPYLGNVPSVCWQFDAPGVSARRVVARAVLEALRLKHNKALLEGMAEPEETVLATPPEALTLAQVNLKEGAAATFLYPDPPLGKEELAVLKRLRPEATFLTPLTKLVREARSLGPKSVAVSISESTDITRYGLSPAHQQTLTDELHLYLLLAGLSVAYGGSLQGNMNDAQNFTLRLFELARSYAPLAQAVAGKSFCPIVNVPPWPLHRGYGDPEMRLFGRVAELERGPEPDLPWSLDEIFPEVESGWRFAAKTPQQRYAWSRGLSGMRERITDRTDAKVVIGGELRKFQGVVPGVVEEAWWSLKKERPLYLVGAFGGCARAVSDALLGIERQEFSEVDAKAHVPDYEEAIAYYAKHEVAFTGMEAMGVDIADRGQGGLSAALNNGLTDEENQDLIYSSSPTCISELILAGLSRLPKIEITDA